MKKMNRTIYLLALMSMAVACGNNKNEHEPTEAVPAEGSDFSEDGSPSEILNLLVDNKLQVIMEKIEESEDTTASMISGYIDSRNAPVPVQNMQLLLATGKGEKTKSDDMHTLKIEKDGRVPGMWVAPNAYCRFMLVSAKDTFRFETRVEVAFYRFKLQFKTKA